MFQDYAVYIFQEAAELFSKVSVIVTGQARACLAIAHVCREGAILVEYGRLAVHDIQ